MASNGIVRHPRRGKTFPGSGGDRPARLMSSASRKTVRAARPFYLVTGGCGFIGSHLVERLLAGGARVRVLDDLSTGRRANLPRDAELVEGNVADPARLRAALNGVDGCFHLAAVASVVRCNEHWHQSHTANQSATVALFEQARPAAMNLPVVYASSAAVYGRARDLPVGEAARTRPLSAYGADKLGCELHAAVGAEVHGLRAIGLRFFNVYGPRQDPHSPYSGVISVFADRMARGQAIRIDGDGQQSRDFIFVADVVEMLVSAMGRLEAVPAASGHAEVFNACTGKATTIAQLATFLGGVLGRTPAIDHGPAREGDIRHSLGSPERARRVLGVSAAVSLEEGLRRLLDAPAPAS